MKFSLGDLHRISKWYEMASQYEDLGEDDLTIYDRISEYLEEKGMIGDPNELETYVEDEEDEDYDSMDRLSFYDENEDDEDKDF